MAGGELIPIVKSASEIALSGEHATPLKQAIGNTLADVWQGIVGDKIAAWRISNAGAVNKKLVEKLKQTGAQIDRTKISDRYAFCWFEEASKQDEPEIQELFATLLSNAASGSTHALERRNLELVSRMAPIDAKLLNIIVKKIEVRPTLFGDRMALFRRSERHFFEQIKTEFDFDQHIAFENLIRIGILNREVELDTFDLQSHFEKVSNAIESQSVEKLPDVVFNDLVGVQYSLSLTLAGWSLVRALEPDMFPDKNE